MSLIRIPFRPPRRPRALPALLLLALVLVLSSPRSQAQIVNAPPTSPRFTPTGVGTTRKRRST